MKIKLARTLGYCLGVRRAMDTAFQCLSRAEGPVYSHGELIHNRQALDLLARKGLKLWTGEREGSLIIRAHGLPPTELAEVERLGLTISDATCPRVRRVQKLVAREAERGRLVIIWGKADHPEVVGLLGHAGDRGRVVAEASAVAGLPEAEEVLLVSQTTQDLSKWPEVAAAVRARWPRALVKKTICEATETRQAEVRRLAGEVEALVIVGGRRSGNTARLADVGRQAGLPAVVVESAADLQPDFFAGRQTVGVAAGASTSVWQVAQVLQGLRALARSRGGFDFFWVRLLRVLVLSHIFAALGLAALALVAGWLQNRPLPASAYSFFFFQAAALWLGLDFAQHRSRSRALALSVADPDRAVFYAKYARPLKFFAALAALSALAAARLTGPPFPAVWAATTLATLAHIFLPRPKGPAGLVRTLARPAIIAGGWAGLMVWAPWSRLSEFTAADWWPAVFSGGAVFGPIFVLALMADVLAVQGDRIFGRPTLPTVFGEKAARRLLIFFLAAWALGLAAGLFSGALPPAAWILPLTGPLYNLLLLRRLMPPRGRDDLSPSLAGFQFEALMYAQLLLSGAGVWLCQLKI